MHRSCKGKRCGLMHVGAIIVSEMLVSTQRNALQRRGYCNQLQLPAGRGNQMAALALRRLNTKRIASFLEDLSFHTLLIDADFDITEHTTLCKPEGIRLESTQRAQLQSRKMDISSYQMAF
ncbi:PREDICTED: uncharacterized protein LOC105456878 [Wasmannia auropunctata]|uniref:uncharacterized protein LOC105456878 n=1 Tax=Wasmannia auropunctata TaxID=64793 RepID=UPI0005EFFD10|nr:PREDICTED: uncharacterized protein LOC105456878 [Wasmannia auropunctata]